MKRENVIGYSILVLGVVCIATVLTIIDVQLRLNAMDLNDPTTLPNMAPQIEYLMLPIILTPFTLIVLVVDCVAGLFVKRAPGKPLQWFLVGVMYGSAFMFLPLIRSGISVGVAIGISVLIFVAAPFFIRELNSRRN